MPPFRTFCPSCEIVTVEPAALMIQVGERDDVADMSFICPECGELVSQWINRWAVPVLEQAGCTVIPVSGPMSRHPAAQTPDTLGPLTETEIVGFVAALEDPDWSELLST